MSQLLEFIGNHPLLAVGVVAAGLAVLFNELRLRSQAVGALSTAQAVQLINNGAAVLDIRSAEDFSASRLIDSQNVAPDELAQHKKLKAKKNVLLVCENGAKSSRALNVLRKADFDNVFILKGGIAAWQQDRLPVES